MPRTSTTIEQQQKTRLYGRKAREMRRDDRMEHHSSGRSKWDWKDPRIEDDARHAWQSQEPDVDRLTQKEGNLKRSATAAYCSQSEGYEVEKFVFVEHSCPNGKGGFYRIDSTGVTSLSEHTGSAVPYPEVDFVRTAYGSGHGGRVRLFC